DVVDDPAFLQQDADVIYKALRRRLRAVPFCDYLKRTVYRAAEMTEPFESVPDDVFRRVITASFRETGTPFTLAETGGGKSAVVKNWLTQKSVRREAALLLGFGLKMTVEEVDEMLYKALRERSLDPAVPEELIAWYCYRHGCAWAKYTLFLDLYRTAALPAALSAEERDFLGYLLEEKEKGEQRCREAKAAFDEVFEKALDAVAAVYRAEGKEKREALTEADVENVLCSAVPRDGYGNLSPAKISWLHELFESKRPSRQRLGRVRSGHERADRFDLISLSFLAASQWGGDRKRRFTDFLERTNALLAACGYGGLYVANPYECFILMCILSEDPLSTYCDVWEMSYLSGPEAPEKRP
ncbi:MAG: hypothetical protein II776_00230, partial [Clostridia bacterium]|nr:hypothetical protein [Clostridia bacterium]